MLVVVLRSRVFFSLEESQFIRAVFPPISSGVDFVHFRSEKDSYSLFPVDGVLIQ